MRSCALGHAETSVEVRQYVRDGLDANRETHEIGADARRGLLRLAQLGVCRRSRVDRQALGVANVREVTEEFETFDEALAGLNATIDAKGENRSPTLWQVAQLSLVPGARDQSGIVDPTHVLACFEPLSNRGGVGDVTLHPQTQRLQALNEQERVEGRDRRADVAQVLQAGFEDESGREEWRRELTEHEAVVTRVGLGE